ncbi:MAG: histidine kinase [Sphingomonadaceae bacterium]
MSLSIRQTGRQIPVVPFAIVLASAAGLWLCYFALISLRVYTVGGDYQLEMLWRRGIVALVGTGLTLLLWLVIRLFDRSRLWVRIAVALIVSLPLSIAITLVNFQVFKPIDERAAREKGIEAMLKIRRDASGNLLIEMPEELTRNEDDERTEAVKSATPGAIMVKSGHSDEIGWAGVSDMAFGRYFMFLSWCALYFALLSGEQARVAERREGEFRRAAKAAELRSLRYQVNPHFLFNTLNSLSALVMTQRGEEAEEMIQTLSTFYRRTLSSEPTSDSPLADEIELQKLYLDIEAVRFPERLKTAIDLPEDLSDAMVPGMILQPLVENSVKYAVAASGAPVTIAITARATGDALFVSVEDDGPGTETGDPHGIGIGLGNVRERLEARFGGAGSLEFGPKETGGFRTTIRMPLEHGRG